MTDAPLWPAFMGTLLGALIGGGATVLAVFLTTRAQADHEAEARRQDRIEGAYANLARFIGHNASVLAWVQENGFPSKERPPPHRTSRSRGELGCFHRSGTVRV
jgi:hypothetical protein